MYVCMYVSVEVVCGNLSQKLQFFRSGTDLISLPISFLLERPPTGSEGRAFLRLYVSFVAFGCPNEKANLSHYLSQLRRVEFLMKLDLPTPEGWKAELT